MKLSKLQLVLLVGGVLVLIILLLMSSSTVSKSLVGVSPGSLLAEVIGSGSQNAGQVTFWKDASTITGDPGFIWDNIYKTLVVPRLQSEYLQSTSFISLYPGSVGGATDSKKYIILSGQVDIMGRNSNPLSLRVRGGLQLQDSGAKPTCTGTNKPSIGSLGTLWFTHGNSTKDKLEVCARDSSGVAGWRTLY